MLGTGYIVGGDVISKKAFSEEREPLMFEKSSDHQIAKKLLDGWSPEWLPPDYDLRICPPSVEVRTSDLKLIHFCLGVAEKGLFNNQCFLKVLRAIRKKWYRASCIYYCTYLLDRSYMCLE